MKFIHSLFFKISLIFILSLIFFIVISMLFYKMEVEKLSKDAIRTLMFSLKHDRNYEIDEILEKLKLIGFNKIDDKKLIEDIEKFGINHKKEFQKQQFNDTFRPPPPPHNHKREFFKEPFEIINFKNSEYLKLNSEYEKLFFVFKSSEKLEQYKLIFIFVILFWIFMYIWVIKNLLPLKKLENNIKEFANGNFDIDCKSNSLDEISQISNEFYKAVNRIKELTENRRLFIRNIMHEFKTPILAGKIALSMIEETKYRDKLKSVFMREEALLDEFYRVEMIVSNSLELNLNEFNIEDIIDYAKDLILEDLGEVKIDIAPLNIIVDFNLFSIAIKNIVENGLRYSTNSKVTIKLIDKKLLIENYGKALPYTLREYSEPFALKDLKAKESRGLGFGLYISYHIFKKHGFKFDYIFEDDINKFYIDMIKN